MTGDLELKSLTIDPDAVDPEDVEMLQDMVMAAINEALRQAMELQASATGDGRHGPGGGARRARRPRRPRRRSAAAAAAACPGGAPPNRAARRKQR